MEAKKFKNKEKLHYFYPLSFIFNLLDEALLQSSSLETPRNRSSRQAVSALPGMESELLRHCF